VLNDNKTKGPLRVHTGLLENVRVRYMSRPWGVSSRTRAKRFMPDKCSTEKQPYCLWVYWCKPRSSGSSVEVLIMLVGWPLNRRQAYSA